MGVSYETDPSLQRFKNKFTFKIKIVVAIWFITANLFDDQIKRIQLKKKNLLTNRMTHKPWNYFKRNISFAARDKYHQMFGFVNVHIYTFSIIDYRKTPILFRFIVGLRISLWLSSIKFWNYFCKPDK